MQFGNAEDILLVLAIVGGFAALGYAHLNERFYHAYGFFTPYDPDTRGRHEFAGDERVIVREAAVRGGINLTLSTWLELGFNVVLTDKSIYVSYSTARPYYWLLARPLADIDSVRLITILERDAVEVKFCVGSHIHTVNFMTAQKELWKESAERMGKFRAS